MHKLFKWLQQHYENIFHFTSEKTNSERLSNTEVTNSKIETQGLYHSRTNSIAIIPDGINFFSNCKFLFPGHFQKANMIVPNICQGMSTFIFLFNPNTSVRNGGQCLLISICTGRKNEVQKRCEVPFLWCILLSIH